MGLGQWSWSGTCQPVVHEFVSFATIMDDVVGYQAVLTCKKRALSEVTVRL